METYLKFIFLLLISSQIFASEKYDRPKEMASKKNVTSHRKDDSKESLNIDLLTGSHTSNEEQKCALLIHDIQSKVASYLAPKDYTAFTHLARTFRQCLFNTPGSIGESLRKATDFSIKMEDRYYFFEEFLAITQFQHASSNHKQRKLSIDTRPKPINKFLFDVKHLTQLVRNKPEDFKRLVAKTAPKTHEDIENNLSSYYKKTIKIHDLILDLPTYETHQKKLAAYLIQHMAWVQVRYQVWAQVWTEVAAQVMNQAGNKVRVQIGNNIWMSVWTQVMNQVGDLIADQVAAQITDQVGDQLADQAWDEVWRQVEDPDTDPVRSQVGSELSSHFHFKAGDFKAGSVLKPAIDYAFMMHQLSSLTMIHSGQFKTILDGNDNFDGLTNFIQEHITEDRAKTILENLKEQLPQAPEGNDFVETQLNMLKRHLPN